MAEENKTPTKRQIATLQRRKHIIESAAICFVEQGFHQSSIRDIANRANVSLGNLYNHFESKTELIAEIAGLEAEELDDMLSALEAGEQDAAALQAFLATYFDYVARPENAVLTAEITAEAMRSPQIVQRFSNNRVRVVHAVAKILGSGGFSFPEDKTHMAELVIDLVETAGQRTAFGRKKDRQTELEILTSVVDRLTKI